MSREELVRIDDTGTVHPVGKTASQRLRSRRGAFRLMPAPGHVMFMRYVGEDGRRDEEDGAIVRLAGEVTAPGTLCDIVGLVAQAGWKGELVVADGEASRSIFFEAGNVLGAQTNVMSERLGQVMYRRGVLSPEQVEAVQAAVTESRRFGETAIDMGLLTRERLFELMAAQTEEIVFATLLVADGMFYFLDRYDQIRVASRHHVSANSLLMEGVQRMDESKYFRERIPSDNHVPMPVAGRNDPPEEVREVFFACDGRRSVLEICRACGRSEFEVTRALFQLAQSGFVHISAPTPVGTVALVAIFNDAVSTIFRTTAAAGKASALAEHLAGFATSIGLYDALFAGAGPREDGTIDQERVAQNVQTLGEAASDALLSQWLYEYLAFALFDAGSYLSKTEEKALSTEVNDKIMMLAPKT
jgi:hypothetical protein